MKPESDTTRDPKSAAVGRVSRIVVVDDDERVRRLLRSVFETEGYAVSEAAGEVELFSALAAQEVALITLDLSLRHEDGLAVARSVRAKSDIPIIMVTAKSADIDRVVGLEVGADDYIVKPFNVREVLARVRAVLRRTSARGIVLHDAGDVAVFDGWTINRSAQELTSPDGNLVNLTTAEYRLLDCFVRRPGRVLSRDSLIDFVGGHDSEPLERSVDTIIGRLRKKIETDPKLPRIIKTVRGAGYIFTAKVKP